MARPRLRGRPPPDRGKMPLTVILDAHGGDLYEAGPAAYLETVK